MSITVTTDVFCDTCLNWTPGVTGGHANAAEARAEARRMGWHSMRIHARTRDICPDCWAKGMR